MDMNMQVRPYIRMKVQKVYLLQQFQILGNPTQCLLRHSQAYKKSAKGRVTEGQCSSGIARIFVRGVLDCIYM